MRLFFVIVFLSLVILVAVNFKGFISDEHSPEIVYPGLSGQFFSEIQKQSKTGQIDSQFFAASKIKINDYRINKKDIIDIKVLSEAFKGKGVKAQHEIIIDIFEAIDAEGKTPTKAVFQINLIDIKSQNKIAEYAVML